MVRFVLTVAMTWLLLASCTYYQAGKLQGTQPESINDWMLQKNLNNTSVQGQENHVMPVDTNPTYESVDTCLVTEKNLLIPYHQLYICLSSKRKEHLRSHRAVIDEQSQN